MVDLQLREDHRDAFRGSVYKRTIFGASVELRHNKKQVGVPFSLI